MTLLRPKWFSRAIALARYPWSFIPLDIANRMSRSGWTAGPLSTPTRRVDLRSNRYAGTSRITRNSSETNHWYSTTPFPPVVSIY